MPAKENVHLPRATRQRRVAISLLSVDTVAILGAATLAWIAGSGFASTAVGSSGASIDRPYAFLSLSVAFLTIVFAHLARLYSIDRLGWGSAEFTRIARSLILAVMASEVLMVILGLPAPSRQWLVSMGGLGITFVCVGRGLARFAQSRLLRRGAWLERPTLIVGSNMEAAEVARMLRAAPDSGLVAVGCLRSSLKDELSFDYCSPSLPTLGIARNLRAVVAEHGIDTVIIIASAFDASVTKRMIKELRSLPVTVHISSALSEVLCSRVQVREVGGIPLISLKDAALSPIQASMKRAFDLAVAALVILLGMPVWAMLAVLVKTSSAGPVFYKQERIGRNGSPFLMYKFRSMSDDAEERTRELECMNEADGPLFKIHDDPRVTSLGRWMRKFSLDEFPQLINVLRGEMSLVGPRPPLPCETQSYGREEWRRLEVSPGMTGLWQISGRSELSFREMIRLDVFYIDNWSLGLDASLLVRTVPAVVLARGAC